MSTTWWIVLLLCIIYAPNHSSWTLESKTRVAIAGVFTGLGISCVPASASAIPRTATFSGGDPIVLAGVFNDMRYDPSVKQGIQKVLVGTVHEDNDDVQAVQIVFDDEKVSYKRLLGKFWRNIKPTQENGQFSDKGRQFRSVIWTTSKADVIAALKSKTMLEVSGIYDAPRDTLTGAPIPPGPPIVTEILEAIDDSFSPSETQVIDPDMTKANAYRSEP